MKRDLNLVREILLALEPVPAMLGRGKTVKIGEGELALQGYTPEEIEYHLRIMTQGGLLNNEAIQQDGTMRFFGLTWNGHEYVDDIRNPEAWKDTMGKIEKYGGAGMDVAWELAKAWMRTHGLPF